MNMTLILRFISAFLLVSVSTSFLSASQLAFISGFNGAEPVMLYLNGQPLRPRPLNSGDITFKFDLPEASLAQLTASIGEGPRFRMKFLTPIAQSGVAVLHAPPNPGRSNPASQSFENSPTQSGEELPPLVATFIDDIPPRGRPVFRFFNTLSEKVPLSVQGRIIDAEPFKITNAVESTGAPPVEEGEDRDSAGGGGIVASVPGSPPVRVSVEDASAYLIVLFKTHDGRISYSLIDNSPVR